MERKKIIAIISLIVLVGGVVALALWIKNKQTKEQKEFQNNFAQAMRLAKNKSTSGTIAEITGKKLILRSGVKMLTELKINEATPVVFMDKEKKLTNGKITDVKVGDIVDLEYDRATTDVVLIIKFKL